MARKKMSPTETTAEVEMEDFDDVEVIGTETDTPSTESDDVDEDDLDIDDIIQEAVTQQLASVNKKLEGFDKRLANHRDHINTLIKKTNDHEVRLDALEKTVSQLKDQPLHVNAEVIEEDRTKLDKVLDGTFGTVGNVLHSVVDTVAFVAESAVDIVTLGRAKRTP